MKIRNGFVSNSSSSSFCCIGWKINFDDYDEFYNILLRMIKSNEKVKESFLKTLDIDVADDKKHDIINLPYEQIETEYNYDACDCIEETLKEAGLDIDFENQIISINSIDLGDFDDMEVNTYSLSDLAAVLKSDKINDIIQTVESVLVDANLCYSSLSFICGNKYE